MRRKFVMGLELQLYETRQYIEQVNWHMLLSNMAQLINSPTRVTTVQWNNVSLTVGDVESYVLGHE